MDNKKINLLYNLLSWVNVILCIVLTLFAFKVFVNETAHIIIASLEICVASFIIIYGIVSLVIYKKNKNLHNKEDENEK